MSFAVTPYTPDNLSSLLSEAQDKHLAPTYETTGLTYDEMLNFAPASLKTMYPNPMGELGVSQSLNPVFYVLAAAALGYIFFVREKPFSY